MASRRIARAGSKRGDDSGQRPALVRGMRQGAPRESQLHRRRGSAPIPIPSAIAVARRTSEARSEWLDRDREQHRHDDDHRHRQQRAGGRQAEQRSREQRAPPRRVSAHQTRGRDHVVMERAGVGKRAAAEPERQGRPQRPTRRSATARQAVDQNGGERGEHARGEHAHQRGREIEVVVVAQTGRAQHPVHGGAEQKGARLLVGVDVPVANEHVAAERHARVVVADVERVVLDQRFHHALMEARVIEPSRVGGGGVDGEQAEEERDLGSRRPASDQDTLAPPSISASTTSRQRSANRSRVCRSRTCSQAARACASSSAGRRAAIDCTRSRISAGSARPR